MKTFKEFLREIDPNLLKELREEKEEEKETIKEKKKKKKKKMTIDSMNGRGNFM